jgi:hypothetical protein
VPRTSKYTKELQEIQKESKGLLRAEDVVRYARDPDTVLHSKFTWDDTEAAQKWRIREARKIIRVCVDVIEVSENVFQVIRPYVSLRNDRMNPGGGYRALVEVMTDTGMRKALLREAMADLQAFEIKYKRLEELVPVFQAIRKVHQRAKGKKRRKKAG